MIKKLTVMTTLFVIIYFPFYVTAQEFNFYNKEADIVNGLLQPTSSKPTKTTRGLTRGLKVKSSSEQSVNTRTIVVVSENKDKIISQAVTIHENVHPQGVNMKIQFNYDSCVLQPAAYPLLAELGKALKHQALRDKQISLLGHTDADGSDQYNLTLSLKRARSVKNYLVGNFHLAPSRINIFGYGETMPLLPNVNAYNKQINRRVEIRAE